MPRMCWNKVKDVLEPRPGESLPKHYNKDLFCRRGHCLSGVTPAVQGQYLSLKEVWLLCGITASGAAHGYTGPQLICSTNNSSAIDGVVWVGDGGVEMCLGNHGLNVFFTPGHWLSSRSKGSSWRILMLRSRRRSTSTRERSAPGTATRLWSWMILTSSSFRLLTNATPYKKYIRRALSRVSVFGSIVSKWSLKVPRAASAYTPCAIVFDFL